MAARVAIGVPGSVREREQHRRVCAGDPSFSLYGLTEEHRLLRKAGRQLAEDRVAPRAAEIDELG